MSTEIGAWYFKLTMLYVKYIQFSPRSRKSHVKEKIQYEVTCFSPFLATRCLHVAYDFRMYSQLSLPICRLSANTLCNNKHSWNGMQDRANVWNSNSWQLPPPPLLSKHPLVKFLKKNMSCRYEISGKTLKRLDTCLCLRGQKITSFVVCLSVKSNSTPYDFLFCRLSNRFPTGHHSRPFVVFFAR